MYCFEQSLQVMQYMILELLQVMFFLLEYVLLVTEQVMDPLVSRRGQYLQFVVLQVFLLIGLEVCVPWGRELSDLDSRDPMAVLKKSVMFFWVLQILPREGDLLIRKRSLLRAFMSLCIFKVLG